MDNRINFEHSIFRSNLNKIFIIGTTYTLFEIIGLIMSTLGFFQSDIRLYVAVIVLFHLIYLSTVFLFRNRFIEASISRRMLIDKVYYIILLLWGSAFTALVYMDAEDITIYSIVCMLLAALFIVEPKHVTAIYAVNWLFFSVLVYSLAENTLIANGMVFKSLIVTCLSFIIARSNYQIRKSNYQSHNDLALANEKLKDQAVRDSLTKLYNNGYIFDYLEMAMDRARTKAGSLCILMIDIDDFKQINDAYGHLTGDDVIKSISRLLLEEVREQDVVARYGGEEFIIVLNETTKERGLVIAERIRKKVESTHFNDVARVTVSLGLAQLSDGNLHDFIRQADNMLYEAKASGKNTVK